MLGPAPYSRPNLLGDASPSFPAELTRIMQAKQQRESNDAMPCFVSALYCLGHLSRHGRAGTDRSVHVILCTATDWLTDATKVDISAAHLTARALAD